MTAPSSKPTSAISASAAKRSSKAVNQRVSQPGVTHAGTAGGGSLARKPVSGVAGTAAFLDAQDRSISDALGATVHPGSCGSISSTAPDDFYRSDNYRSEESVGYLMRRIVNRLAQDIDRAMEPRGLTNAQWVPLLKLFLGKAHTVAELARECELDAGSMTRLLDRIEAKGLCRRIRSSEDRRVVNLELTEEGRQAAEGIPAVLCDAQNALLRGFSQKEWDTLQSLLARMLNTAQGNLVTGKKS